MLAGRKLTAAVTGEEHRVRHRCKRMVRQGGGTRKPDGVQKKYRFEGRKLLYLWVIAGYLVTAASEGSLALRHHFSSWLKSVISMPGMTMNLQESISRGSSSSGSWQTTRQY